MPCPLRLSRRFTAALLVLLAAGCGNNPYPPGDTARSTRYVALLGDLRTLDPGNAYAIDEGLVTDLVCPSYFRHHYLKRDPYVLELNLGAAEPVRTRYPPGGSSTQSEGRGTGERWTFRIRQDLRFQDDPCFPGGTGRKVTAADFLYAFRRMADPRMTPPSPVVSYVEDKILGFAEYVELNRKRRIRGEAPDYAAPVEGLQLDRRDPEHVFHVTLNQPFPQLRYLMNMHWTAPVPHEAWERYGSEMARHPVGCGPYILTEYTAKQQIVLERNPHAPSGYYPTDGAAGDREAGLLADAGRALPRVDRIVFRFVREGTTGWTLFQQGYLDSWSVTQENLSQVVSQQGLLSPAMAEKGVRLYRAAAPSLIFFVFNMDDPVVGGYKPARRKLRQAISSAIDSQAFIDLFYQGMGTPAEWAIPPELFGYEAGYRNPHRRHSVDRAKRLLAEAGYPEGVDPESGERLTLYYDNTGTTAAGRQFVGLLQKQLDAVGIRLESRVWRDIVFRERMNDGKFQFLRYSLFADYPDPEQFLSLLFGPNRRPGQNAAGYRNPEYDRLFVRMRALDDGPERLRLIRRMREIAVEDCPWVPLDHYENLLIAYDWVSNLKRHGMSNDYLMYQAVDGPRRARLQREWNQPDYGVGIAAALLLAVGAVPAALAVRRRRRRKIRKKGPGLPTGR